MIKSDNYELLQDAVKVNVALERVFNLEECFKELGLNEGNVEKTISKLKTKTAYVNHKAVK